MEALSWAVLGMALLVAFVTLAKVFKFTHRSQTFPPGPKPWPIIGNLNLIGHLPHQSLHKLSQKYGQLMHLKFGSYPVVVASSSEMAKLFLKTHDHIFASRPPTAAAKYTTYNYCNITWAPYGPYWRQGRKIYATELFSSKQLESYEYIRIEERKAFISRLYSLAGKPILVKDELSRVTLGIISRMVLGKKYFSDSKDIHEKDSSIVTPKEFQEMLDELFMLNGVFNIGDWIPWIDFLDLQGYLKRMKALFKKIDRFHDHVVDEHKARKEADKEFMAKDMVDVLLQVVDDPNLEVKLSTQGDKGFTLDLLAGGTDSSATTVEWAMSELLKHPQLIKKATEELDRVLIGKEKWVEERDIPKLPYIDAIMKETMRLHPVTVMLAPHLAIEDCNVAGYDVLKGTRLFINTWSIGRDPTLWDAPEEFRPERFLGKEIDVKGQNFELLPFGSGRRKCPGYTLGLKMIKSSLANILYGFNWKLPDNVKIEDLSMEEVFGLSTHRKVHSLQCWSLDSQYISIRSNHIHQYFPSQLRLCLGNSNPRNKAETGDLMLLKHWILSG